MIDFVEVIQQDAEHRNQVLASGYNGCDVVVMGQGHAKSYIPETDNEVVISISSHRWGEYEPVLNAKFKDVLRVNFDDTAVGDAEDKNAVSITDYQAKCIVRFFEKHYANSSRIIIHCFAGVSRSRSTASALCKCFGLPFRYTALNKHVEGQITKVYCELFGG